MKSKVIFPIILVVSLIVGSLYLMRKNDALVQEQAAETSYEMLIYHNLFQHYYISYPSYLTPVTDNTTDHEITRFIDYTHHGDMGMIAIVVSTTTARTARAWVEEYNRSDNTGFPDRQIKKRIEQEIIIDGIPALVVHPYEDFPGGHEEYTNEKRVLVVKDGRIFDIGIRTSDPEKIWNSFRFE